MSFRSIIMKARDNGMEVYKVDDVWRFGIDDEIAAEMFNDGQIWSSIFYPRDVWTPELVVSGKKKQIAKQCIEYTLSTRRD